MTHSQALSNDHLGFPGRDCDGDLVEVKQGDEFVIVRPEGLPHVMRVPVRVYRCRDCGLIVSVIAGYPIVTVLNVYDPAPNPNPGVTP